MKKSILYYLFAVVCTVCLFTACSDDDDDDVKGLTVDNIVGTYTGTLEVMGQNVPNVPITVSKIDAGKVKVELKNFAFAGITVGNVSADCTATPDSEGDELNLHGTTNVQVADLQGISLPVTIAGDATATKLDVDITITGIPAIGNITVEYEGTK